MIGDRLKLVRSKVGLSQAKFASLFSIPQTTYFKYENGGGVPDDLKQQLSDKYNIDMNWLITGEGAMYKNGVGGTSAVKAEGDKYNIDVPMTSLKVSAGPGQEWQSGDLSGEVIKIPRRVARRYPTNSVFAAAEVVGDSMEPTLHAGEPVVFVRGCIDGDGIYVLSVYGELLVKRLEFNRFLNKLRIISDNPKYPVTELDMKEHGSVTILGKVVIWVHGEV